MKDFLDLVERAYDRRDIRDKAVRFYIKVQSIWTNWSSHGCNNFNEAYDDIGKVCKEKIKLRQDKDFSILQDFIETIKNDGDYRMGIKAVTKILTAFPENLSHMYNHTKLLMTHFLNLVENAYSSIDQSDEAFRFYDIIRKISEKDISKLTDTSDIQIVYFERLGYAHQLNGNYQLAAEYLKNSVNIQRDKHKELSNVNTYIKLYDIGLLCMILGNCSVALASFKEALKLIGSDSESDPRRKRWILKRIDEVKKLSNH
ncbi:unnamed protein product [Rotaria socialis]|uniref:Tetratricopeptide repeat protein n=2 Tax=Rotaria socialis TaxID=392032 RepID=A0A820UFT3_9BILA|nr:unnamed protein product [Rotaria socialis]CAF4480951.1 unnamed protein product [Rotaria socialis]